MFLHENYRGYFHKGTLWNGARDGGHVDWRGRRLSTTLEKQSPYGAGTGETHPFYGSLLDVQTDGSAQVYMRNRYYDPSTGKFTQEDPIGIAGGLNLYGFAKGDPVNLSDPFGLCPPDCATTFSVSVTALMGAGSAGGGSLTFAVDTKGDFVFAASAISGVGGGFSLGVGGGAQYGSVASVAGGNARGGQFDTSAPTTATVASGPIQASVTVPGKGMELSGVGVSAGSVKWGVGAGVFVTQQRTVSTAPQSVVPDFGAAMAAARGQLNAIVGQAAVAAKCPSC